MLLIGRFIGESVQLGEIRVVVLDVVGNVVKVRIGSETLHMAEGQQIALGSDVTVKVVKVFRNRQMRFGFEAPRSIKIMRTELVEVSA